MGHAQVSSRITDFLQETIPLGAPLTVLVASRDEVLYCDGFGTSDAQDSIPSGCDTVYDMGSVSKQFTAAAVLRLEMDGALSVNDPIRRFFPDAPVDKASITIHQLLTHTAGLTDSLGDDYDPLSKDEMVAGAFESRLRSVPGEEHHYSNLGYSLLAAIVEEASQMPYEAYLGSSLFEPAGMRSTGYVLPEWNHSQVAIERDAQGRPQGAPFDHPWASDGPYWNLRGNGGLLTTAMDLFRWHLGLRGEVILSDEAKAKMFSPHVLEYEGGSSYYGYGTVVQFRRNAQRSTIAWHNGGNGWSFADYWRFLDDDLLVLWMTSNVRRDGQWSLEKLDLTVKLARLVLRSQPETP